MIWIREKSLILAMIAKLILEEEKGEEEEDRVR